LLRARRWPSVGVEGLVLGLTLVLVSALILYPLAILLLSTLRVDRFGQEAYWTLDNYAFLLSRPIVSALGTTLVTSAGTALAAGFLGIVLAWLNARTDLPGRDLLESLNLIPFFLSPYVGAMAWVYLAAPRSGFLNAALREHFGVTTSVFDIYSTVGMVWVLTLFFTPYMYLFVVAPFRRMDPSFEEAARMSGCGLLHVLRRVTLPLALPAILSGAIIVFVSSVGEFGVPLGHPKGNETLSTQIFVLLQDQPARTNQAAAVGAALALVAIGCVAIQRRIIGGRDFTTITGKGSQPRTIPLGRWKYPALAFNLVFLAVAVVLPLVALGMASLSRTWLGTLDLGQATLEQYAYVLTQPVASRGIMNSIILSTLGAAVCVVLGLLCAYLIHRSRLRGRAWLDFVTTVPVGVPGIVLAIGILLGYVRTPLYATLLILLVGYISRYLPYGQRNISSVLLSLSPELEESARTLGCSWPTRMRRIIAPLVWPGMVSAWLLLFVIFMRELPISILLYSSGTEVLPVALWRFVENETAARAAAFAMVQVGLVLVAVFAFRRVSQSLEVLQ
jgi:iron(III) transport system permease protein